MKSMLTVTALLLAPLTAGNTSFAQAPDYKCWSSSDVGVIPEMEPGLAKIFAAVAVNYMAANPGSAPTCSDLQSFFASEPNFLSLQGAALGDKQLSEIFTYLSGLNPAAITGLDLSGNNIEAFRPWLNMPTLTRSLVYLDISHNNITGSLTFYLNSKDVNANLLVLDASSNQIGGTQAQDQIGQFTSLLYLNLRGNKIDQFILGTKPQKNLAYLDLGAQRLNNTLTKFVSVEPSTTTWGRSPDDRMFELVYLGLDDGIVNGPRSFFRQGPVWSLSIRKSDGVILPSALQQLYVNSQFVDVSGWNQNLSVYAYHLQANDSGASEPVSPVKDIMGQYLNSSCASGQTLCSTSGTLLVGGCKYYQAIRPLRHLLDTSEQAEAFDSSLSRYQSACGD